MKEKKLSCGHTKEEHERFSRLPPEEQEIIQNMYGCYPKYVWIYN